MNSLQINNLLLNKESSVYEYIYLKCINILRSQELHVSQGCKRRFNLEEKFEPIKNNNYIDEFMVKSATTAKTAKRCR